MPVIFHTTEDVPTVAVDSDTVHVFGNVDYLTGPAAETYLRWALAQRCTNCDEKLVLEDGAWVDETGEPYCGIPCPWVDCPACDPTDSGHPHTPAETASVSPCDEDDFDLARAAADVARYDR